MYSEEGLTPRTGAGELLVIRKNIDGIGGSRVFATESPDFPDGYSPETQASQDPTGESLFRPPDVRIP